MVAGHPIISLLQIMDDRVSSSRMNLRPHESFITVSLFHDYLAAVSTNR